MGIELRLACKAAVRVFIELCSCCGWHVCRAAECAFELLSWLPQCSVRRLLVRPRGTAELMLPVAGCAACLCDE